MRNATVLCLAYVGVLSSVGAADVAVTLPKVTVASIGAPHVMTALTNAPTLVIEPVDVVQDSIKLRQTGTGTNMFAVMWTYTEAGAQKALAFWEAHPSPYVRHSEERKTGWLKSRTDKCIFDSADAAKTFMAKLKNKKTDGQAAAGSSSRASL